MPKILCCKRSTHCFEHLAEHFQWCYNIYICSVGLFQILCSKVPVKILWRYRNIYPIFYFSYFSFFHLWKKKCFWTLALFRCFRVSKILVLSDLNWEVSVIRRVAKLALETILFLRLDKTINYSYYEKIWLEGNAHVKDPDHR